ncbi:MAG: RDD family protein [Acidobacteria bacterium]|nr:RDD family protein [Acidobacteriota bacterium]
MQPVTPSARFCGWCGRPLTEEESSLGSCCTACLESAQREAVDAGAPPAVGNPVAGVAVRYGGFWIRVLAYYLDQLLLSAALVVSLITLMVIAFATGSVTQSDLEDPPFSWVASYYVFALLLMATYDAVFTATRGATPGKMACGLRVVRFDGQPLTMGRAFGRHFAKYVSSIPFALGFLAVGISSTKQGWHDLLAETLVVRKEKPNRG